MPERNRGYLRKQRLRNIERRKKLISQRELMYHGYKTLNDPDFKEGMLHKGHSGRLGMGGTAVKTNTRKGHASYRHKVLMVQQITIQNMISNKLKMGYSKLKNGRMKMKAEKKKVLIVIDVQNDFVTGSLGTPEAQAIIPNVKEKFDEYKNNKNYVILTKDTHHSDYADTSEGRKLPEHCMYGTKGWEIVDELDYKNLDSFMVCCKSTFGFDDWDWEETFGIAYDSSLLDIEIIGVCTDICVITNALLIKTYYPEAKITVDASCCAGSTPEKHKAALDVMESCQINVINRN